MKIDFKINYLLNGMDKPFGQVTEIAVINYGYFRFLKKILTILFSIIFTFVRWQRYFVLKIPTFVLKILKIRDFWFLAVNNFILLLPCKGYIFIGENQKFIHYYSINFLRYEKNISHFALLRLLSGLCLWPGQPEYNPDWRVALWPLIHRCLEQRQYLSKPWPLCPDL